MDADASRGPLKPVGSLTQTEWICFLWERRIPRRYRLCRAIDTFHYVFLLTLGYYFDEYCTIFYCFITILMRLQ